jgi:hypothetical protein
MDVITILFLNSKVVNNPNVFKWVKGSFGVPPYHEILFRN